MSRAPVALPFSGLAPRRRVLGQTEIHNAPGQPAIFCRVGIYPTFLQAMLERVNVEPVLDESGRPRFPLGHWNPVRGENWLHALLQAWAVAGDVLTFYTERIANEGYLRTAREDLSVGELVRALDYRPQPGTAARAPLAFTVAGVPGLPTRITLARGSKVQSLPVRQELPQTWETLEELEARLEWNALKPGLDAVVPVPALSGNATSLWVRGAVPGLEPGAPLLLCGTAPEEAGGGPVQFLRLVEKAEFQPQANGTMLTRILWRGELDPARPERAVLTGLAVFLLRKRCQLFGFDAPRWKDLPPEVARRYSSVSGGVLRTADAGRVWLPVNDGLPADKSVRLLAAGEDGGLFAGGTAGVFRSLDGGESWTSIQEGLIQAEPQSLLVDPRGAVWLGTADGRVFRSFDRGGTWEPVSGSSMKRQGNRWKPISTLLPQGPVRCLAAVLDGGSLVLYAGTNQGVFRSLDASNGWEPVNAGLPGRSKDTGFADLQVYALAAGPIPGLLFAGTAQGVFRSANGGDAWGPVNRGLPDTDGDTGLSRTPVNTLIVHVQSRTDTVSLFAGTPRGAFRSTDLGRSWQAVNRGLPDTSPPSGLSTTAVDCLVSVTDSRTLVTQLFAGTPAGLFVSGDFGETWVRSGGRATEAAIGALAAASDGTVLAGTPLGGLTEDDWPGFRLSRGRIDLASQEPAVLAGGWAVLYQTRDGEGPLQGIYRLAGVGTVRRRDYTLDRLVTRLEVDTREALGVFDLRSALAFVQSEPLEPYFPVVPRLEPLHPQRIPLDRRLEELFPVRRRVIVHGKPIRAAFAAGEPLEVVPLAEGKEPFTLAAEDEVQVLAPPEGDGEAVTLHVRHPARGLAGRLSVPRGRIVWRSAAVEDAPTGEVRDAETAANDGDARQPTVLILDVPLTVCLDPQTVTIHANVAEASQGGTIAPTEVLGSGDASRANQSFTLRQPLTWLRVPTATGFQAALEVRVNGVLWKEVPSLYEAGPRDMVYMVRTGSKGLPMILFGDGVRGARLPTGQENVTATYRTGQWNDGADAGHIILMQSRPVGLQGVTNPLPAPPGTPPESQGDSRERAPRSVRTLGRIVSLSDYEDFAYTWPGVARARAQPFWTGGGHLVHLTVAAVGGRLLAEDDPVLEDLARAIDKVRDAPRPVRIDGDRRVLFDLSARVLVDRRYRLPSVEAALRKVLAEAYAFEKSRFVQTVTSAGAVTLMEAVEGVVAVVLEAFHPTATPAGIHPHLRAEGARLTGDGRIEPAQLLVINDPEGISLRMEQAP